MVFEHTFISFILLMLEQKFVQSLQAVALLLKGRYALELLN